MAIISVPINMPRLSQIARERAIGMLMAGMLPAEVARKFDVHKSTICRLRTRLRLTGSTKDKPRYVLFICLYYTPANKVCNGVIEMVMCVFCFTPFTPI